MLSLNRNKFLYFEKYSWSQSSVRQKTNWICENFNGNKEAEYVLKQYWNDNSKLQKLHDDFSEKCSFKFCYLPFSIASNFTNTRTHTPFQWPLKKVHCSSCL